MQTRSDHHLDCLTDSSIHKYDLFSKSQLSGSATPPHHAGKAVSTDSDSAPGVSSPDARHGGGSGSENGDGESFSRIGSPVPKPAKDGEDTPGSVSPLGSDSGSETDKDEPEPSPSSAASRHMHAIDILTRVFPSHKRSVLELVLQGCGKDVVQAIEQILNHGGGGGAHTAATAAANNNNNIININKVAGGPDGGGDLTWTAERMMLLQSAHQPTALSSSSSGGGVAPRPLLPGAMTLGSRSAFSPLQPNAPHFGADPSAYPALGTHLGLNPLRLAYSAHSRGLAFMTPYSATGLMPTLGFRPPMDYAFSDLIRERTLLHKEQGYASGLYGPLVNNTPDKQ